ncbi:energy transducer TonB [Algoriphagus winogradskyi]|uniref:TonB protein C-terminal n=2 Tax=Algoriphagus winogradskyi TaxID=237017 RepID=A0ABY1NEK1_9BACT|nr:energy transducer TonB [Algoriphagus winogradskyi]SMP07795.1 TonB protein C-terminal [Algoriphagus winogradskyi]
MRFKSMKCPLSISIFFLSIIHLFGQESNCFENASGAYWPMEVGLKKNLSYGNNSYVSTFAGDSVEFEGKYFLVETQSYSNGDVKTKYWRTEDEAVFSLNQEKNRQSMELPSNPEVGTKWKSSDQVWSYEVVSLTSTYSTPFCEFSDLLEVKTESSEREGTVYNLYYKKGLGMIGLNVNGQPFSYIKPNRKPNERGFIAFGCEDSGTSQEIEKCTYAKISQHISENLKAPKSETKGRILLNVRIDENGDVSNVEVLETVENGEALEVEAIRVMSSLPKFIPAQVDDNQPIATNLKVPFRF